MKQVELQPSPATVFPSSHYSPFTIIPSPQIGLHNPFQDQQMNPFSLLHIEEHPSPSIIFESSHSSSEATCPSPHLDKQVVFTTGQ